MFKRALSERIQNWLFQSKVILLFGARQVGKTTLCKNLIKNNPNSLYLLCEQIAVKNILETQNISTIKAFLGEAKLVVLDEAQVIPDIGKIIKLLHDTHPEIQLIATGSCSFELANRLNEPLTGRALQFMLYPLGFHEMQSALSSVDLQEALPDCLRFGLYPGIYKESLAKRSELLINLSNQYLYKDLLIFENIKNSQKINQLLKLLALQLGNAVSIHELATQLGLSRSTVERFLDILEKMFIIIRLGSFSRNLRKELTKKAKYYFYDVGIRNALLNAFAPLDARNDIGALWENFAILERLKFMHNRGQQPNCYFWRTHDRQEIDYLEESGDHLKGFECKWQNPKRYQVPSAFTEAYPQSPIELVHSLNWPILFNA